MHPTINWVVFKLCTIMVLPTKQNVSLSLFQFGFCVWNYIKIFISTAIDLDGVYTILDWLSYIPAHIGCDLPIVVPNDVINRPVGYMPTKSPYDPRWMLAGRVNPSEFFLLKILRLCFKFIYFI